VDPESLGIHGGIENTPIKGPLERKPGALAIAKKLKQAMDK
jgi:hypothetical protein